MAIYAEHIVTNSPLPTSTPFVARAKAKAPYLASSMRDTDSLNVIAHASLAIVELLEKQAVTTPVPEYGTPPQETVPSRTVHKDAPEVILFSFTEDANLVESYRAALVDTLMPYGYRAVAVVQSGKTVSVRAVRSLKVTEDA